MSSDWKNLVKLVNLKLFQQLVCQKTPLEAGDPSETGPLQVDTPEDPLEVRNWELVHGKTHYKLEQKTLDKLVQEKTHQKLETLQKPKLVVLVHQKTLQKLVAQVQQNRGP